MHRHPFPLQVHLRIVLTAFLLTAANAVFALEYSACGDLPSEDARLDCYDRAFGAQDAPSAPRSTRIEVERTDEFVLPVAGSGFPDIASRPAHGPLPERGVAIERNSGSLNGAVPEDALPEDAVSETSDDGGSRWRLPNPFKR